MKRTRASSAGDGDAGVEAGGPDEQLKGEVGRMVDSSQADDRRLIRLVRERRLLYARNNMPVASYYTQVKNLWDDVAKHMAWSVADVRRKWSHIRNSYSRHLRNEMHGACTTRGRMVSRWYLADELEFLREHMATDMRPTSFSSFPPTMVDMDGEAGPEPVDVKPFLQSPWFRLSPAPAPAPPPAPAPAPAPATLDEDSCTGSSAFAPDENASFFQFFRGIHADYQELPARKQRLFKRKCLELLHELLDAEEHGHGHGHGRVASTYSQHGDSVLNLSNSAHVSDDERDVKPVVDECYILPTAGVGARNY